MQLLAVHHRRWNRRMCFKAGSEHLPDGAPNQIRDEELLLLGLLTLKLQCIGDTGGTV